MLKYIEIKLKLLIGFHINFIKNWDVILLFTTDIEGLKEKKISTLHWLTQIITKNHEF